MILDNGVIRTLDPSLPTARRARDRRPARRRRRRHARVGAPDARARRPRAAAASSPRSPTRTSTSRPGRSPGATCASRRPTRSRRRSRSSRRTPAPRHLDPRHRAGATRPGPSARRAAALDAVTGSDPGRALVEGLPLALAQLAPASPVAGGDLDVPGGVVERDADGRADRRPARGVGLALPRALRHRHRGRVGRRDARGDPRRERPRRRRRSTTRTAGSAPPRSSAGSTSARACRCGSGSRSPPTGCASWRRCRCASRIGDDFLRLGYVKTFMDGTLGSQTALMLDGSGVQITSREELEEIIRDAAAAGWPVAVHAIGDRANRDALDAFEATRDAWQPLGLRQRIEHAQCLDPADLPRFAELGVACSSSSPTRRPTATWRSGSGATGSTARTRSGACWDSGAVVVNGSDAPVEELDPLAGIRAGVLRTIDDRPGWRPGRGAHGRAGASSPRPSRPPGSPATSAAAAGSCPASSPISSCSRATRSPARRRARVGRGRRDDGRRPLGRSSRRPGTDGDGSRTRYDSGRGYTHDAPGSPVRDLLGGGLRGDRRRQVDGAASSTSSPRARAGSPRSSTRAPGSARARSPSGCAGSRPRRSSIRRSYAESPPARRVRADREGRRPPAADRRDAPLRPRLARLRRPRCVRRDDPAREERIADLTRLTLHARLLRASRDPEAGNPRP